MKKSKKFLKFFSLALLLVVVFSSISSYATTTLTSIEPIISYEGEQVNEGDLTQESINQSGALSASVDNQNIPDGLTLEDGSETDLSEIFARQENAENSVNENQTVTPAMAETGEIDPEETDSINSDIYKIGDDKVTIDKYVNGNVYVIANEVIINANVDGNVYAIAKKIENNSSILGSVYEIANSISFNNNIHIKGTSYLLADKCEISKSVTFAQDLMVGSTELNFDANVFRNIYAITENIVIGADSYIKEGGNICYSDSIRDLSGDYTEIIQKADVVSKESFNDVLKLTNSFAFKALKYITALVLLIFMYVIACKYNLVYEASNKEYTEKARIREGLFHFVIVPIIGVLFLISIIGAPVGFLMLVSWFMITSILAVPAACIHLSKLICKDGESDCKNSIIKVLLSLVLFIAIDLIKMIPVAGEIIHLVCVIYGYGVIISAIHSKREKCCKKSSKCEKEEEVLTTEINTENTTVDDNNSNDDNVSNNENNENVDNNVENNNNNEDNNQ